jgi:anti-sigma regulatory factor (Ser/Thr protein kinase)
MFEYRARFPSKREAVPRARRAVADFARHWFGSDALADIECSVGEALANAFEHGGATDPVIEVSCEFDGRTLVVDIRDYGGGFARWNASDYIRPLSNAPRGFGIFIMRQLMDTIEYSERGARIRLTKRVPDAAAADSGAARTAESGDA